MLAVTAVCATTLLNPAPLPVKLLAVILPAKVLLVAANLGKSVAAEPPKVCALTLVRFEPLPVYRAAVMLPVKVLLVALKIGTIVVST